MDLLTIQIVKDCIPAFVIWAMCSLLTFLMFMDSDSDVPIAIFSFFAGVAFTIGVLLQMGVKI